MKGSVLEIIEIWNPILRQQAKTIDDFSDTKLQTLIDDMIETLDLWWVWMAAPQVSKSIALFMIHIKPTANYPDLIDLWYQPILNPEIIAFSEETIEDREGCLSIPGATPTEWLRWLVPRSKTIKVSYQDRHGEYKEEIMEWLHARIFQHEFDHLQGLFFTDRMKDMSSLMTTKERRRRR